MRFENLSREGLVDFVERRERERNGAAWALYVERGPMGEVVVVDGLVTEIRHIHIGPTEPYQGHLFFRSANVRTLEERNLLMESISSGTHNVVVRNSRASRVEEAVEIAIRE